MIKLIDNGPDDSCIEFWPRPQKKGQVVTRQLIYGHVCKWCNNVIQALFRTDKQIDLNLYEQTRVMSQGLKNNGELLKVIPNTDELSASGYKVDFYDTPKGKAQLIRLKNHLVRWEGLTAGGSRDDVFEPGERCCRFIGMFSRNPDRIISDLLLAMNPAYYNLACELKVPLQYLRDYVPALTYYDLDIGLAEAIGTQVGPVVFVDREEIKKANIYSWYQFLDSYKNKLKAEAEKSAEATNTD